MLCIHVKAALVQQPKAIYLANPVSSDNSCGLYIFWMYIKLKIIALFLVYKVCDVNSIPANLRNSKPWTISQNSLDFTKFPLTEDIKTLRCKNGELEYQVKMEDTNYDAKIFGRRTRVRMNESQ